MFNLENKTMYERREFVSDTGRYKYIYSINSWLDLDIFENKHKTYKRFKPYFKRDAIVIGKSGHFNRYQDFVRKHPVFVKKRVDLSSGASVELVDLTKSGKAEREWFDKTITSGAHILEERVIQSEVLAALNASSVNTVRCVTFNTNNGFVIPNGFIRTGRDGMFVDNGAKGGIFIGVDSSNGQLSTDGITEYGEVFEKHPNTGIRFKGYQLPEWRQMLEICREMAAKVPQIKYISWDMAHTSDGWIVIEGNSYGQFIGQQGAWKRGMKTEIEDILHNTETFFDPAKF
jgi:hypothetical protein